MAPRIFIIFFSCYLSVIDEYFVEFVHSMARKSTNPSDSVEQLRHKMFSLFVSGERQANFRATFTPSKNYVFSRRQLTSLYSRVASIIVSILTSITHSDESAVLLPRAPGQRRDLWKVPALFGDTPVKRDFLPLGFQFSPQPEQGQRCDLLNCSISNDTPWKIFEGCWHSFHLCCLDVGDVCPICREGVEDAIRSLSSTANKSVKVQGSAGVDGLDSDNRRGIQETDDNEEVLTSQLKQMLITFFRT